MLIGVIFCRSEDYFKVAGFHGVLEYYTFPQAIFPSSVHLEEFFMNGGLKAVIVNMYIKEKSTIPGHLLLQGDGCDQEEVRELDCG